jgi:UDP-N-acetylmuramoyl-L-alanyl-D-glutamate--2,6-diaminopimelate ligase
MQHLANILSNISTKALHGPTDLAISELVFDSRKITPNSLYVAIKGTVSDGHSYIDDSIAKGATGIVCEDLPQTFQADIAYIQVENSASALAHMASNFYGNPSAKLKLVGVTGTNGKTSTATLLYDVFANMGKPSALISTVEYRIAEAIEPSTHTTPDVIKINQILARALEAGCEYAFMEVSSHGIHQGRTEGLQFAVAGFTNITHDHLDYHKTFLEYLNTKKRFFDELSTEAIAITNIDDKNGLVMLQNTKATKKTYALKEMADFQAKIMEIDFEAMQLNINGQDVWTTLTGQFNAYNLLLVYGIAEVLDFEPTKILSAMSQLKRVKGRFETFKSDSGIFFVIDYAHTPDALASILDSINSMRTRNEQLISVFGCGGNRDSSKRPEMGKISAQKADLSIITSDNPRFEAPEAIIAEIKAGISPTDFNKFMVVEDRREAIATAIKMAKAKDIILVAGKGHEDYQDIQGTKHHFDDREVVLALLK